MAGLVPAIHVLLGLKDVDARHRSSPSAATRHSSGAPKLL